MASMAHERSSTIARGWSLRAWAAGGIVAVVGGVGGVAFFDTERSIATQDVRLRLCVAFGMLGVAGLAGFASGLRRHLDEQLPSTSLLGLTAYVGCVLMASTLFFAYLLKVVSAEYTDRITGNADVVVRNGLDELTTGAWTALALTMLAVGVAGLRYAAGPRWHAWISMPLGALVAAAAVAGIPAAGYLPGAAWLLLTSIVFIRRT